ncbi:YqiJ family protein [Shewanella sp. WXL01]|uniref:DUF1449 family protein n=1 Tax=Shewanella maritima TaxID=2520507 RepID=A0A411PH73_9GAMM|nr:MULTISPECIES: YqiJ family protein [Shewanella]NKF48961.1 YqiJ family protein [Shewanella sp. WXL01]QBF82893.1 DUF1449 family protein [Shewanella maritima]
MLEFLLLNANTPFAIALSIVLMLALLEGVGMVIGFSISNLLDHLSPIDLDVDVDLEVANTGVTPILGWLCLNRLPLLIWIVLFLTSFALLGYAVNYVTYQVSGQVLTSFIAGIAALALALFTTSFVGRGLAKVLPKNESMAVSKDSFSGQVAKITLGTARFNHPAEAVLVDQFNQKHYVMVAPETDTESFNQHEQVVLLRKQNSFWVGAKFEQQF